MYEVLMMLQAPFLFIALVCKRKVISKIISHHKKPIFKPVSNEIELNEIVNNQGSPQNEIFSGEPPIFF